MSERPILPSLLSAFVNSENSQNLAQLSDEEFLRYAQELAHIPPSSAPSPKDYLKCALDKGYCVLPLTALREVVTIPRHFTMLPASPPWMLGIAAWHGEPIAVLDLLAYFSQSHAIPRPDSLLLIATHNNATIGLSAVVVSPIPSPPAGSIRPLAQTSIRQTPLLSGIIGLYEDAFVLDLPSFITTVVQHINDGRRI
jgi:chemotaxis signal transduction protein